MPDWVAPALRFSNKYFLGPSRGRDRLEWDRSSSFYLQQGRISLDHAIVSMEMEEVFENGRSMDMRVLMPYWDPDLVDLLYRVPPDLLDRGDRAKALVRETLANRFSGLGLDRQKKVIASRYFTSVMLGQGSRIWDRIGGAQGSLAELGLVDPARLDEFAGRAFSSNIAFGQPDLERAEFRVLGPTANLTEVKRYGRGGASGSSMKLTHVGEVGQVLKWWSEAQYRYPEPGELATKPPGK